MSAPPAGMSEADWLATPASVRTLILSQQEEIDQLRQQLTALATQLASLRERIGRNSRNSSLVCRPGNPRAKSLNLFQD